jgi:hypothetical protein
MADSDTLLTCLRQHPDAFSWAARDHPAFEQPAAGDIDVGLPAGPSADDLQVADAEVWGQL